MSLTRLISPLLQTSLIKRTFSQMYTPFNTHSYVNSAGVYTVEVQVHPFSPDQVKVKTDRNMIKIELLTLHGTGEKAMLRRITKYVDIPSGFDHTMIKTEYKSGFLTLKAYKK